MPDLYILNPDHSVSKVGDFLEWAKGFENSSRRVCLSELSHGVRVSTVFLGLDHGECEDAPLLFETMIFIGPYNEAQERYSTWDEAVAGHNACVAFCKAVPLWQHLLYIFTSHVMHYFKKIRSFIDR